MYGIDSRVGEREVMVRGGVVEWWSGDGDGWVERGEEGSEGVRESSFQTAWRGSRKTKNIFVGEDWTKWRVTKSKSKRVGWFQAPVDACK